MPDLLPIVILVPTHNRPDLLQRTVKHITSCQIPKDRQVTLIVIENGCKSGIERFLFSVGAEWLDMQYEYFSEPNKSAALNYVISKIEDSVILFFDDDIRVHPEILVHYSRAIGKLKSGYFFGGGLLVDYEKAPPDWLLQYLPVSSKGWHPTVHQPLGKMDFFGANWAAFSMDVKNVGGFDTNIGPGSRIQAVGQETAMQNKLKKNGVRPIYVRDAVVWHYVPESRCSPEWALKRTYRTAVKSGLVANKCSFYPSLFGLPRWLLHSIIRNIFLILKSKITGSTLDYFDSRYNLARDLGKLKGMRAQIKKGGL
jgi:glycosyltransferase involved in cell wall biosynthesis